MSAIQLFENGEFSLHITEYDDTFRVDATDLAHSLGMRDAYRVVESLPGEEKIKTYTTACTSDDQGVWEVLEPGFYRAIGQRQPARIKNLDVRAQVVRFQNWVYRDVLPAIRRHGTYALPGRQPATPPRVDPFTVSFEMACDHFNARTGSNYPPPFFNHCLRLAGYLRQQGCVPRRKKQKFFFPIGNTWEVRYWALDLLFFEVQDVIRQFEAAQPFAQLTLDEGFAGSVPSLKRGES